MCKGLSRQAFFYFFCNEIKTLRSARAAVAMALFVLVAALCLTMASGRLFQRYLTVLVPILSCLAAGVGGSFLPGNFWRFPLPRLFSGSPTGRWKQP
jgi:hypothetical protein